MADKGTTGQPDQRPERGEQPARVHGNGGQRVDHMHGARLETHVHTGNRRQYVGDWLATSHSTPGPGRTHEHRPAEGSEEASTGPPEIRLLPSVPAPERRTERSGGPAVVRRGGTRKEAPPSVWTTHQNDVLTERFRKYLPTQVTEDFAISQLPDEISSWITQVLRIVERSLTDSRRAATKASTAYGEGGRVTVNTSGIVGTPTSINYPSTREDCSSRLFSDSIGQPCGGSTGKPEGNRTRPVVSNTLRQAASHLATAFRGSVGQSPLHVAGTTHMLPVIRRLLRAGDNTDPPKAQQKAITPKLLRAMYDRATNRGRGRVAPRGMRAEAIADIAIIAYFFAMRSCENNTDA